MLICELILALFAVVLLAIGPASERVALVIVAVAGVDAALGASISPAITAVAPLFAFLTAALTLAALAEQSGLSTNAASMLARWARGNTMRLYALVCVLSGVVTSIVSLDGAVVVMVPLVRVLSGRFRAPFAPLFLGVVVVANASSVAVPQGNPTNLVVMGLAGLSPGSFAAHMVGPGVVAAVVSASAIALWQRRQLSQARLVSRPARTPLTREERRALGAIVVTGLVCWLAPVLGVAPWWPSAAMAGVLVLLHRGRRPSVRVPWRIAAQLAGLVVVFQAFAPRIPELSGRGLTALLLTAVAVGGAAAVANNLPVSVAAQAFVGVGPAAYAVMIGLAVGALAAPQGSVATLIARDLAGPDAPRLPVRRFAPLAGIGVVLATVVLWTTL